MVARLRHSRALRATVGVVAAVAPVLAQAHVPTVEDARRLARDLDRAVAAGDREAFERCFAPTHALQHARLMARYAPLLKPGLGLERSSRVVDFRPRAGSGIAMVRAETRSERSDVERQPVVENLLLVLAPPTEARDDTIKVTLWVEVDPEWFAEVAESPTHGVVLDCETCNYALDVDASWLAVPNCPMRSGCLESYTLFALGADLTATLSIHVGPGPDDPRKMLSALTVAQTGPRIDASVTPIVDWMPSRCADTGAAPVMHGARCRVTEPELGRATDLRLAALGRVGYLLTVEGPTELLGDRAASIDELLDGFHLLDPDIDPDRLLEQVLSGHVGGEFEDDVYRHDRFGIRVAGPRGWPATMGAGQYAFDVRWDCPVRRGTLHAKGLRPATGLARWTQPAADRMVATAMERDGLDVVEDTGWTERVDDGFRAERAIELRSATGQRVLLRLALSDDLLVVLEGDVRSEVAVPALRTALESLRRQR